MKRRAATPAGLALTALVAVACTRSRPDVVVDTLVVMLLGLMAIGRTAAPAPGQAPGAKEGPCFGRGT